MNGAQLWDSNAEINILLLVSKILLNVIQSSGLSLIRNDHYHNIIKSISHVQQIFSDKHTQKREGYLFLLFTDYTNPGDD